MNNSFYLINCFPSGFQQLSMFPFAFAVAIKQTFLLHSQQQQKSKVKRKTKTYASAFVRRMFFLFSGCTLERKK